MSGHTPWSEIKRRPLRKMCAGALDPAFPLHYPGDLFPACKDCACSCAPRGWRCGLEAGHTSACYPIPAWWNLRGRYLGWKYGF